VLEISLYIVYFCLVRVIARSTHAYSSYLVLACYQAAWRQARLPLYVRPPENLTVSRHGGCAVETAAAEARQFQAIAAMQVMCNRSKSERRQPASAVAPTLAWTLGRRQGCNARRASPRVYPCTSLRLRLGGVEAGIRDTAAPAVQGLGAP
jgi:hypothetical protein